MDLKRPLPIAIAISLAMAAALYGWWALNPMGDAVRLAARAEAVAAVHAVREAADSEIEPAAASAIRAPTPRATPRQSSAELFAAAATSSDPYALAVKLRNSKTPGGFAVAARLASLCRISYMKSQSMKSFADAMTTTPRGRGAPAANAGLSPDVLSKRTSASQEIEARCRPFIDDRDISQPLADDEFGVAFRDAGKNITKNPPSAEEIAPVMNMLVGQGMLWQAWGLLSLKEGPFGYFEGKPAGGLSAGEFRRAMELGSVLVTVPEQGGERGDLRSLSACSYSATCDEGVAQLTIGDVSDAAAAARIKAMAERIAAALKSNDVEAFRAKKP